MDVSVVVAFPVWTGDGFQAAGPKRVDARSPFSLYLHGGSVWGAGVVTGVWRSGRGVQRGVVRETNRSEGRGGR